MLASRRALSQGMVLACGACVTRAVFGQRLPDSKPSIAPTRSVASACGIDRLKNRPGETVRRLANSGLAEVDRYIPMERRLLDRLFQTKPQFGFFDDGDQPQARTLAVGDTSEVLVGVKLLATEKLRNSAGWQTAVIGILAHEWAHAFQYSSNLQEKTFLWETHADYLAGWYLGNKVAMGVTALNIDIFANSLYERGNVKGYFDPDDYGSPSVRVQAMRAGFAFGRRSYASDGFSDLNSAVDDGYVFVSKLRGK